MRIDNRDGYLREDNSYNRLYKSNGGRGMAFRKQTKGGRKWKDHQYGGGQTDNSGKWPLRNEEYGDEETPFRYPPVCGTGSTQPQPHLLHQQHIREGMPPAWWEAQASPMHQESPNAVPLAHHAAAAAATDFGGGGGCGGGSAGDHGCMGMEPSYHALMGCHAPKNHYNDMTHHDGNINHHGGPHGGIEVLNTMMMMAMEWGDPRSVPTNGHDGHFGREEKQRYGIVRTNEEQSMVYGFEPQMRFVPRRAGKWSPRTTSPRIQKRSFHANFLDPAASSAGFSAAGNGFTDSSITSHHQNTSTSSSSQAHLPPHHIAWIPDPWGNPRPMAASNGNGIGPRPASSHPRRYQAYGGNRAFSSRGKNCATFGNNNNNRYGGSARERNNRYGWQSPVRVNDEVWMENRAWGTVIKIGNARNQVLVRSSNEDREIFWCDCSKYRQTWSVKVTLCVSLGFVSRTLPPNAASLQFRDITPQDYDLLCALDDHIPSRKCMPTEYIDNLPAGECGQECGVCLETIEEDGDPRVLTCPTKHQFHYECIKKWLATGNTCPLDKHILDGNDNSDDAKDIKKEDTIASMDNSTSDRNDNEE